MNSNFDIYPSQTCQLSDLRKGWTEFVSLIYSGSWFYMHFLVIKIISLLNQSHQAAVEAMGVSAYLYTLLYQTKHKDNQDHSPRAVCDCMGRARRPHRLLKICMKISIDTMF